MVISAVAGMAGVGKTALAVHWARRVAGRFPDGQLYVNLRGYDAEGAAVTPEEVTGWFLAALGVPAVADPGRCAGAVRAVPQRAGRAAGADRAGQRAGRGAGAAAAARQSRGAWWW